MSNVTFGVYSVQQFLPSVGIGKLHHVEDRQPNTIMKMEGLLVVKRRRNGVL